MKKVGHFRRAVWLNQNGRTLESILRARFRTVGANSLHEYNFNFDQQCLVAHNSNSRGSQFVHLVVYERGAGAAVIPTLRRAEEALAAEVPPPAGQEYIQSQIFLRISGQNVVWTTHNSVLKDASIYQLMATLIESLGGRHEDTQFQFRAIVDPAAYRQAFERGIEEIDLGIGDFQSTLEALRERGGAPRPGLLSGLASLVMRRPTNREIRAASNLEGRLTLKPGRDWADPEMVNLLSKMASGILDSYEDEFAIVTKDGLRLTRESMSVKKEYLVTGNRRVLDAAGVATQLAAVLDRLEEAGVIHEE